MEIPAALEIQQFSEFQSIILSKLQRMILSTPSKSCELYPIPARLLKQILPSTIEIIADIINISLMDGIFPMSLKETVVKLLLKKANLYLLDRNYRLVSNLGYVSKLTEHAAATQLFDTQRESWPYGEPAVSLSCTSQLQQTCDLMQLM